MREYKAKNLRKKEFTPFETTIDYEEAKQYRYEPFVEDALSIENKKGLIDLLTKLMYRIDRLTVKVNKLEAKVGQNENNNIL